MRPFGNDDSRRSAPDQVLYRVDAAAGRADITLNRPEKRNALSVPMRYRIADLMHRAERAPDVAVIVLSGNGPSFCSGNEINEDWGQRGPDKRRFTLSDAVRYGSDLTYGRDAFTQAIQKCAKPTVLRMHGYCAAAAYFMIATRCDLVVAAEDAKIGAVEGRFLGPAGAVSHIHLNRILGTKAARRIGYTAEPVSGREAFDLGLVHRCVPAGELDRTVDDVVAGIAGRPRDLAAYLKARILQAEALLGAGGSTMNGLLLSHFLRSEKDELDFWREIKGGNVASALAADKRRAAAARGREERP